MIILLLRSIAYFSGVALRGNSKANIAKSLFRKVALFFYIKKFNENVDALSINWLI